jgi:hypothetical protein
MEVLMWLIHWILLQALQALQALQLLCVRVCAPLLSPLLLSLYPAAI